METLERLLAGNRAHTEVFAGRFEGLLSGQRPEAVTVCCSDSRVLGDHLWGNDEPGRLFACQTIGNRVTQRHDGETVVAGDVLYPLLETGTELAVVIGHTGCGAITAAYDALMGNPGPLAPGLSACLDQLEPHVAAGLDRLPDGLDRMAAVNRLVEVNVDRQVDWLLESETVPDDVTVAGAVYDFHDAYEGQRGEVHLIGLDGEREPDSLRADNPDIADRIRRLGD